MNRQECLQVYKLLSQAYPNTYKYFSEADIKSFCDTYCGYFHDLPVQIVGKAVKEAITKSKYKPPTPGEVEQEVDQIGNRATQRLEELNKPVIEETAEEIELVKRLCIEIGGLYPEEEPVKAVDAAEINFLEETVKVIDLHFGRAHRPNLAEITAIGGFLNG